MNREELIAQAEALEEGSIIDRAKIASFLRSQASSVSTTEAKPMMESEGVAVVTIKPMQLSDGRTDYFVSIKVGEREVTPHVFREEYKAAYHVALYDWLLNGVGDEPDVIEFGPNDYPARVSVSSPASEAGREPVTLGGMIAAVYGNLDAEDCAMVDRAWMEFRGIASPPHPANQVVAVHVDQLSVPPANPDEVREALEFLMKTKWKSVDKDNMEFEGRVTCYQLDKARAALSSARSTESK